MAGTDERSTCKDNEVINEESGTIRIVVILTFLIDRRYNMPILPHL